MDIWTILQVSETKDKEVLKKAYRRKLSITNPEDDPEGFMELRSAYEQALKLADIVAEVEEDTEDTKVVSRLKQIYKDYSARIDESSWQELFNMDEFVSLEESEHAFNIMMRFLMDNFFLPQRIWKLIVQQFDIVDRKKELSEIYPENFIEYIINNSLYEDILDYDLLEGRDEVIDNYLDKYYSLDRAISKYDINLQERIIEEMENMDGYHPYFEVLKVKHKIQALNISKEEKSECKEVFEDLLQSMLLMQDDFPQDGYITAMCGDINMLLQDYEEAGKHYNRALELSPESYIFKAKLAEQKFSVGEFQKARDMYMDLLKINHFDNNVRAGMVRSNLAFVEELKKKLEVEPEDKKSRMEMVWCYYQSYKFEEAIKVLDSFEPDEDMVCEYNNVKGRTFLCLSDYNSAMECFFIWKQAIEAIPEDDDSEDAKAKKKRYEYVHNLIGTCYLRLADYEKAKEYFNVAMAKEHEESILTYEIMCELEYKLKNYDECIRCCERLLEKDNRSYMAYNYMAKACFELEYIKETMIATEKAISIYPYVSEPYALQVKVYMKFNQPDNAKEVIKRYRALGVDSQNIDFYEAKIYALEGKYKEAINCLDSLIEKVSLDKPEETDIDNVIDVWEEKGYCLEKLGDSDKAMEAYKFIVFKDKNNKFAYGRMGIIYKNKGNLIEAMDMFDKQIDLEPSAFYYINRGIINRYLSKHKSALEDFKNALIYDPNNVYSLSRIGLIYETHREFEEALENYTKALEYASKEDRKEILVFRARVLQCMNRFEESKSDYENYFQEFGLNADTAYDYSELLQRMNLIDDAIKILARCIDELPYSEDVQMCIRQMIFIYGNEGYVDRANEAFMLAINHDENDCKAYASIGEVFRNNGLYKDAKRHLEKAVKLDIKNKQNYYSELVEVVTMESQFNHHLKKYVEKAFIDPLKMTSPLQYIKMSRLNRCMGKHKEANSIIDKGLKIKRCYGCFYDKCHEALYEKGLIYEAMMDYEMALMCYREALKVCGHNTLYEKSIKRIESK